MYHKFKDYSGQRFNHLLCLKFEKKDKNNRHTYWIFRCDCGKEIVSNIYNVKKGAVKSCGCQRQAYNRLDLTGKKFGKLTVTNKYEKTGGKILNWVCICDCGNTVSIPRAHLTSGHTKSCGCLKNLKGQNNHHYKGYKDISGSYWSNIQKGAKSRQLDFSITIEDAWEQFIKQNKKCALSCIDLTHTLKSQYKGNASLDRIDSRKGYIKENIQWVDKKINQIKMDLPQDEFIKLCHLVSKNNPL